MFELVNRIEIEKFVFENVAALVSNEKHKEQFIKTEYDIYFFIELMKIPIIEC